MREIKFRVWNKVLKKFDPAGLPIIHNSEKGIFGVDNSYVEHFVVQQYTGLKDKNGVEIYEGDIVEWQYGLKYSDVFEYREERFTITYCKEDAMFLGKKDPERQGGAERNWFYSKVVVGNIFEGVDK